MKPRTIAVVMAGAVARGAFEAGVIRALSEANVRIVRIIAASSGALNGSLLASGVRTGDVKAAADTLHTLWLEHASWTEVFHTKVLDLVRGEGISDQQKLLALLRNNIQPSHPATPNAINLRIVIAPLAGVARTIGTSPATSYEAFREFDTDTFASQTTLEAMFTAATASAAFPIVFAPVEVEPFGPCIDGGTVNNTPIKLALGDAIGNQLDAIVVVSTSVELATRPAELHGLGLVGHLAEMLINERLYRDLNEATDINAALAGLDKLVTDGQLTDDQRTQVLAAIRWTGRRQIELIRIRPVTEISGNAFSGFFDRDVRAELLEAGYQRGLTVLRGLGWLA